MVKLTNTNSVLDSEKTYFLAQLADHNSACLFYDFKAPETLCAHI